MEKYIEKYKGYEINLKDILKEIKNNFSQTNSIISEYITKDLNINYNKTDTFKNIIKNYENSLYFTIKKIKKIIDKKNKTIINIVIFILIFIFIKFILEINFLFCKVFNLKNSEIKKRKYYYIIIAFLIIFFVLLFFISFDNNNLKIVFLAIAFFME